MISESIGKKIHRIALFTLFSFIIIAARLFYLQVNLTHYFYTRSQNNFLRIETTNSLRGNILDCNGVLLATNRPVTQLNWQGTGNTRLDDVQISVLKHLEIILGKSIVSDQDIYARITYAERYYQKYTIAYDLPFELLSKIEEQLSHNPNLRISTHVTRHYPYKSYASHILGYLGNSLKPQPCGKMGLEKLFEETLKGHDGRIQKTINSIGRNLSEVILEDSLAGNNVKTTLDIKLQHISEQVFPEESRGTLILFNPRDGALVSLVSRPTFDPDIFSHHISSEEWSTIQLQKPFLNRAFHALYPPGSIFKLITTAVALERNLISPESTINCKGYVHFAGRNYWCHRHAGHGILTTGQALAQSCNTLFFEIGKIIDIDMLTDYAQRLGLGQKTNILLSEQTGLVPSRTWKQQVKGEPWWPGETLSVSIGQSFLLVTPIQVARMIGSIFTGYLVQPRILIHEPIVTKNIDFKPETLAFLQESMKHVVTTGTGKRVSQVKNIHVYAKTSTAQISSLTKRAQDQAFLEHGWFVAYFYYKHYDPLVLVILVENAGTSQVVTGIAKNFLSEYKKLLDQREQNTV